jgi:predicted helicase
VLEIKASHKPIKAYYEALATFQHHGVSKETSIKSAFADLLKFYGRKLRWNLIEEDTLTLKNGNKGSVDGALVDEWDTRKGFWEAKDESDDLTKEVKKKFEVGYPRSNILFQKPTSAILYQDGSLIDHYDLRKPEGLIAAINDFFSYHIQEDQKWSEIVDQFKERIPESARKVIGMIEEEKKPGVNSRFKAAFQTFAELCRQSINPNLADPAIEEMLVQHLLTARLFASVFDNPDFVRRNVIAAEIEKVIDALTARSFNKSDFFKPLDHFYVALENKAKSITDWSQKQSFINVVYEKFFQGFSVKVADTHGIVYTPQPIVDFMVRSVQHILKTEFGRSLADEGVHILDPFVGTGNFILRIMKEIAATSKSKLPMKYASELHCNEVMLLPYYIASMNIEHEYFSQTKEYKPFDGICLVDTFELAEPAQTTMFSTENTERVEKQKKAPIHVIVGNPPYNAGQVNENDNNKNRKYPVIDKRVATTFAKESKASNKNDLGDPYVKALRWAADRLVGEGIVAFVTNANFLDGIAFDGVRKCLEREFDSIFLLDLGGNVRKNTKLSGTTHNVFGIQVGVSVNFLVRRVAKGERKAIVRYSRVEEFWKRADKYRFLNANESLSDLPWEAVPVTKDHAWIPAPGGDDFQGMTPLGTKDSKRGDEDSVFALYCLGNTTNRDTWAVNFNDEMLAKNMSSMIDFYNDHVGRFSRLPKKTPVDDFVTYDEEKISWSRDLKADMSRGHLGEFSDKKIRRYQYRPFSRRYLFFDQILNEEIRRWPNFLPTADTETENCIICVPAIGNTKDFQVLSTNAIPDLHLTGDSQCFPFYTYDEDGSNRRENITDWALNEFRTHIGSAQSQPSAKDGATTKAKSKAPKAKQNPDTHKANTLQADTLQADTREIGKWDIFHYVYGLLHQPEYRTKYAANLRRELPRIPIPDDATTFWKFSDAGKRLAELHVHYEDQKEYPLEEIWKEDMGLNFRVTKMKLSKDKTELIYNDALTLRGIPPEAFEYRLGNRSALDWIIDQYQVSTDKRSGITNDPNREDDPQYILRLIRKVIFVSLETVKLVNFQYNNLF